MVIYATEVVRPWILEDDDVRAQVFSDLQSKLSYEFRDTGLLKQCFVAGDSESPDREGHRGLSQIGDILMGLVVICDGSTKNLSRGTLQTLSSEVKSKEHCARIAKMLRLDQWLKISERQVHIGVQPTSLKNTVAALVGATWIDSLYNFNAVLKVILKMGLLNHVEQIALPPEASLDHSAQSNEYWSLLPESDLMVQNAIRLQSPGQLSALWQMASSSTCPSVSSHPTGLDEQPGEQSVFGSNDWHSSIGSPRTVFTRTTSNASSTPDLAFTSGPPTSSDWQNQSILDASHRLEVSEVQQRSASPGDSGDLTSSVQEPNLVETESIENGSSRISAARVLSTSPGAQRSGGIRKSSSSWGGRKALGRPRTDTDASLIDNYIISENKKRHYSADHAVTVAATMKTYRAMIVKITGRGQAGLAALAVSVGDSSALSILKAAIQGWRSQDVGNNFRMDKVMSIHDRLRMINYAEGQIELHRLVRNYHIMELWRDITATSHGVSDVFVVSTPEILGSKIPRAGNPLHISKSQVGQGMISVEGYREGSAVAPVPTRLRKLGERLARLVRTWGEGVLLLLGHPFTEPRILEPRDRDFDRFVALMDDFEGGRIREVSILAEQVLRYFRTGDRESASLALETVAEEVLREIPRLSHEFAELLTPSAIGSRVDASIGPSQSCPSRL